MGYFFRSAHAASAANAMDVIVGELGHVVVNDVRDRAHVDAASHNIGGDENLQLAVADALHHAVPVALVSVALGLAFAAFGAWAVIAGSGILGPITFNGERTSGPVYLLLILGGFFCFTGFSFAASGLRRSRLREWIRDEGEMLVFGTSRAGRVVSLDGLPKDTIEEVVVHRPRDDGGAQLRVLGFPVRGANGGAHIRVRSDEMTVRLGARLPDPDRAWLKATILAMAHCPAALRITVAWFPMTHPERVAESIATRPPRPGAIGLATSGSASLRFFSSPRVRPNPSGSYCGNWSSQE